MGEIDWGRVLHGSQGVTLHQPIPVSGTVVIEKVLVAFGIKVKTNAIIETESKVSLKETHEPLFDLRFSIVVRGSGGFGGEEGNTAPQVHAPDASPDHEVTYQTRTDQALTYDFLATTTHCTVTMVCYRTRGLPQTDFMVCV